LRGRTFVGWWEDGLGSFILLSNTALCFSDIVAVQAYVLLNSMLNLLLFLPSGQLCFFTLCLIPAMLYATLPLVLLPFHPEPPYTIIYGTYFRHYTASTPSSSLFYHNIISFIYCHSEKTHLVPSLVSLAELRAAWCGLVSIVFF